MNTLSASILILLCIWTVIASRHYALVAMAIGTLFLTQGQAIDVGGFSLLPSRILVYVCYIRVMFRSEFSFKHLNRMDWALIALYTYMTTILVISPGESVPLRIAKMLDILLGYFAFRGLITSLAEFKSFLRVLALLLVPFVALLAIESMTKHNYFSVVGGNTALWMRESSVRCFGSFRHPSLLGSLGATFFPLFVGLASEKRGRSLALLGAALCFAIVYFSSSGGPLSAWATGVIGLLMWPLRMHMRAFRWASLLLIAVLAMVMKAPVWYLIAKLSALTGGTGWHRAYLIDVSVRHIDEWWLMGMPTSATHGWFPYNLAATGGADITNQYISFGLNAGLIGIVLFVVFLTRAYSFLGLSMAALRIGEIPPRFTERFFWTLGVMLTVHLSNWLGITYWDQFSVFWVLQMAAISSICQEHFGSDAQFPAPRHIDMQNGSDCASAPVSPSSGSFTRP